jgi:O-succinylbenzoic acid--CoA ligase
MEAPDLSSPHYWESESLDLRLNPRRPVDTDGLRGFLEGEPGLKASVVIATSGSSGRAKFVILPKAALLASARAVNAHCGLTSDDLWLGGLSTFHVGGLGIHARAFCNGARVRPMAWDSWTRDGSAFLDALRSSQATLTSLTPAHLWDLVRSGTRPPDHLRGLFLGGGVIDPILVGEARELGWPVWPTYGMSETSSQIATSLDGDGTWLDLLPHWETRIEKDSGRLALRGPALFAGSVERRGDDWIFDPACDEEGWYTSGDRCEVECGRLRFVERADDAVKVLGELVSLASLNARLTAFAITGIVVALSDPRRGHELVLVRERGGDSLARFNEQLPPLERVGREVEVAALPRTDIGKVDRLAAMAMAT